MAYYQNIDDSIQDVLYWMDYFKFQPTTQPLAYAQRLKDKNYYSDSVDNYYNGLKRFL